MRIHTRTPPLVNPRGVALSDSRIAAALAYTLESQFQVVKAHSLLAVIELVDMQV
jgi:hypothetical protein